MLVLCHGNICRSPFAERLLTATRPELVVASAGLAAGAGNPAESGARVAAQAFDVPLEDHRSQPADDHLVESADLILVMEGHQEATLARRWPAARDRTRLLGDFRRARPYRIRDPWGQEADVFRETFAQIADAVALLGERLTALETTRGGPR